MPYEKIKKETYLLAGLNTKASPYLTPENEVLRLENMHFLTLGAMIKRQGTTAYLGATVAGRIGGLYEFVRLSGASQLVAAANTNIYTVTSTYTSFKSGLKDGGIFSFVTFVDRLFAANGQDFFKYDGSSEANYSLPPGVSAAGYGVTGGFTSTITGLSGTFVAAYGYLNNRGYFGPANAGITVSLNGISYNTLIYSGLSVPSSYGITALAFYRTLPGGNQLFGTTLIPSAGSGATFVDVAPTNTRLDTGALWFTLAPQFLEIYNNQLMLGGFSTLASTLFWSEIGEPEQVQPESFAEFRTNDGDVLRGFKSYLGDLVVGKGNSVHKLSGEVPSNFSIQQITDQYGVLSHRAMVVYDNYLAWLDVDGVCRYNGAQIDVLSEKIEDVFARMNTAAAVQNAVGVHNRPNNEIWFSFPVDGSLINNITVVYDYVAESWTIYKGFNASALCLAMGRLSAKTIFYGSYSGSINYFDENVENDNGVGITCVIQPRFISNYGQSTEQLFRRLYLNVDPIGGTQAIGIELFSNYATTPGATYTMYQSPFQSRIDFGISAKTLSPMFVHSSATHSLKVFGFTVESRYQRST
jgi:hypothetical protein